MLYKKLVGDVKSEQVLRQSGKKGLKQPLGLQEQPVPLSASGGLEMDSAWFLPCLPALCYLLFLLDFH